MSKHWKDRLELNTPISRYKKNGKQRGDYSRLRSALRNGVIQGSPVLIDGRIQTVVNKEQADAYLASVRPAELDAADATDAAECAAPDLAQMAAALADIAVSLRQILTAVSQKV